MIAPSLRLERREAGLVGPLSFEVAEGECVALMGASGSGKSLLLRVIVDLDPGPALRVHIVTSLSKFAAISDVDRPARRMLHLLRSSWGHDRRLAAVPEMLERPQIADDRRTPRERRRDSIRC